MHTLSAAFLQKLVAYLDNENTVGIALAGSYARDEGNLYSDVDLWHYLRSEPAGGFEITRLEYIDCYLVSIKATQVEKDHAALRTPKQAIWAVPGIRQAQILVDKDGALATLWEAAWNFRWDSLQVAGDTFASSHLGGTAEEIYKILDGLARKNEAKTLYAIWSLSQEMADALLVQRGVLIPTENAFIDLAQTTAGKSSRWTQQFRLAIGLDPLPNDRPAFISYGIAGLRLYRETVSLLQEIIRPADAPLVRRALEVIQEAGY